MSLCWGHPLGAGAAAGGAPAAAPACNETISEGLMQQAKHQQPRSGSGPSVLNWQGQHSTLLHSMIRALGTNLPRRGRGRLLSLHALLEVALVLRLHLVHQRRLRHRGLQLLLVLTAWLLPNCASAVTPHADADANPPAAAYCPIGCNISMIMSTTHPFKNKVSCLTPTPSTGV